MNIFIMRHGQASNFAQSDELRSLTDFGKKQAYSQGEWLFKQGISLDKVLVSPYRRTRETFDEINLAYQQTLANKIELEPLLIPFGDSEKILNCLYLLREQNMQNVLIISHIPIVGELIANLTHNTGYHSFHPATLLGVNWDGSCANIFVKNEIN